MKKFLLSPKLSIAFGITMFLLALLGMKLSDCGSWECMALWSRICAVSAAAVPVGWAVGLIVKMAVDSIHEPRKHI